MNLNPAFPEKIAETLRGRGEALKSREKDFKYRRYAYIYLKSLSHSGLTGDAQKDTTSLFETYPKEEYTIGSVPKGGHLDLYETDSGIRRLKPQLTSVSINHEGGGDVYNSYIREVEVQFKVYSLSQLNRVEDSFFRLGSEVELNFGWLGSTKAGEKEELKMSIYNFGFSMASDGSYDCNLKGLAGDVFPGAQKMGGTLVLNEKEELALGEGKTNPVDVSAALMAKWKHAFGLDSDEDASDEGIDNGEIMMKTAKAYSNHPKIDFYMAGIMNAGESESVIPFMGDDPVRTPYVKFKHFIDLVNILSGGADDEVFKIAKSGQEYQEIKPNTAEYGSADPRKYIFPGDMSDYGEDNEFTELLGGEDTVIGNILISLNELTQIVNNKGKTVNDVFQPPKVTDILADLSSRIANVSGGLVNIIVVPVDVEKKEGEYLIQNKVQMQRAERPEPFIFKTIGEDSMVKDISIDTEFDADLMLMMTVGNVKNRTLKLAPLQSVYDKIPDIEPNPEEKKSKKKVEEENKIPSKDAIGKDGVDDSRANSISATMRKKLSTNKEVEKTIQPILPFQLKLSVTLDGISGIKTFSPITADRLPTRFKSSGIRFLILGQEHSFDGQGGWTTSLKTAMTMGNV